MGRLSSGTFEIFYPLDQSALEIIEKDTDIVTNSGNIERKTLDISSTSNPKISISDYISLLPNYDLRYKLHSQMIHPASPIHCPEISEPIDIVYTWVNGSDPDFLQQVQEFKAKIGKPKDRELVSRRFHGKTR